MPKLPSWATTLLACLAGLIQILNATTFGFISPWRAALTVALVFIAALGIGPLTGAQFRNALHISQSANTVIGAVLAAATVASTTLAMSTAAHAIIAGALTVLAGLGFGTIPTVVPTPAPTPAPVPPAKG